MGHKYLAVPELTEAQQERFWAKVAGFLWLADDCWAWCGFRSPAGYGRMWLPRGAKKGKAFQAHRVAWSMVMGPIPDGLCVLHRCDNPSCVNPQHLFLGTYRDNTHDCIAKGRFRLNTSRKLTLNQAEWIRAQYRPRKVTLAVLAAQYGVSSKTISRIVRYKTYCKAAV